MTRFPRGALVWLAVLGCGSAPPASSTVAPAPSAARPAVAHAPASGDGDLADVAARFGTAALRGDRPTARHLTLTYDEVVAMTTKQVTRDDYEQEVTSFLDGLAREGGEAGPVHVTAHVTRTETLRPSEKRRRFLQIGIVQITVTGRDGQAHDGPPFLFVHTEAGWRYSVKH
jgi:hypothetical protein